MSLGETPHLVAANGMSIEQVYKLLLSLIVQNVVCSSLEEPRHLQTNSATECYIIILNERLTPKKDGERRVEALEMKGYRREINVSWREKKTTDYTAR